MRWIEGAQQNIWNRKRYQCEEVLLFEWSTEKRAEIHKDVNGDVDREKEAVGVERKDRYSVRNENK